MNIPATVWSANISTTAMLCYGHITVLANKEGYCYASNNYFKEVLKVSTSSVVRYLNQLIELGVIKRKLIFESDKKTVKERRLYINAATVADEHSPTVTSEHSPTVTSEQYNNTSNNNTSINILDVPSVDDIKGKIFFKIVELYPKNRIGNRQHGLKKFNKLDIEQCKLAARNLKRYLKVVGTYVKSLQNYIEHECYTEEWLQAEESKKQNNKPDTKKFSGTYDDID